MDDPNDRVVASHYRHILSFTAEEPTELVPGKNLKVLFFENPVLFLKILFFFENPVF